jgi:hypothetical protein
VAEEEGAFSGDISHMVDEGWKVIHGVVFDRPMVGAGRGLAFKVGRAGIAHVSDPDIKAPGVEVSSKAIGFEAGVETPVVLGESVNEEYGLCTRTGIALEGKSQGEGGGQRGVCVAIERSGVVPAQGLFSHWFNFDAGPGGGVFFPFRLDGRRRAEESHGENPC